MGRIFLKHSQTIKPQLRPVKVPKANVTQMNDVAKKNKKNTKEIIEESVMMTTAEKVEMAQEILNTPNVKKIKNDKGLIERVNTQKTILTEDNKELLVE